MDKRWLLFVIGLSLVSITCGANDTFNGMVYATWATGSYSSPLSDISIQEMTASHNNWMSIVYTWYQPNINGTIIAPVTGISPSQDDIVHATQTAQKLGLKVALKPHVDLSDDSSHWRGEIGQFFSAEQWATWFDSYQNFIYNVSALAQTLGADLLIIGTELSESEPQIALWRSTIAGTAKISAPYNIYKNGVLNSDWENYSWSGTYNLMETDVVYPGDTYSLSANAQAWGAVSFYSKAFSTSSYTFLVLAVSAPVNNYVFVALADANGNTIEQLNIGNYLANCSVTPNWQIAQIPLADLFGTDTTISRVNILNFQDANGLFYLDDINFV